MSEQDNQYQPAPEISEAFLFHYRAVVVSAYDADTVRLDIDLGFGMWKKNEPVRVARINAPELRGKEKAEGKAARDFLKERLIGEEVILRTYKDNKGKYGRYIAEIVHNGENVSDWLAVNGHAKYKIY